MKTRTFKFPGIILSCILFAAVALLNSACQKDDSAPEPQVKKYADIVLADIKSKEAGMTTAGLVISNSSGILFKAGDILVYKTNLGNYGKMEIVSVQQDENYKLTFKAITFKPDGTLLSQTTGLSIRGTWLCDLDTMTEVEETGLQDFWNERINATDTQLTPKENAAFVRFTN